MARSLNIDKFIINVDAFEGFINVDASEVINLFSNLNASNWLTQPIVDDCRNIFRAFQEFQQFHLQHFYRETNKIADALAKLGRCQSAPFVYYVTPPFDIIEISSSDSNSIICTHFIRATIANN